MIGQRREGFQIAQKQFRSKICWGKAYLLALLCVMFSCVVVTLPCGVLGQVWYLIVSIPDPCLLPFFKERLKSLNISYKLNYRLDSVEFIYKIHALGCHLLPSTYICVNTIVKTVCF